MATKAFPLHVAIENYQHDYNIGTIVRSANAFNVAGVHIIGQTPLEPTWSHGNRKIFKVFHHPTIDDFIEWAKRINKLSLVSITLLAYTAPRVGAPANAVLVFAKGPGYHPKCRLAARKYCY